MLIVRGRLPPELGAVLQRALEAAADRLRQESDHTASAGTFLDEVTPGQRRADALVRVAECALSAGLDRGTAGDRYQVVVHVDAATLHRRVRPPVPDDAGQAVVELNDAAVDVSAETAQRIACDVSVVVMHHGANGAVLDVGRKTRTIPAAIRRALAARDSRCQFPGCTARRCDGHHITHWAAGGPTRLDNLILLCRRHHRVVHEDGYRVVRDRDGTVTFVQPDGVRLDAAPAPVRAADEGAAPLGPTLARLETAALTVAPHPSSSLWDGEPLDIVWAIDVLREREARTAQ
jgi:hypothetical protein